jgi:hypothetical protein
MNVASFLQRRRSVVRFPAWFIVLIAIFVSAGGPVSVFPAVGATGVAPEAFFQKAPPNDISKAEFFLKKLEDQAARAKGQPFNPTIDSQQALERIKVLKENYPNDPVVEALFQRARKAFMFSKGESIDITPEMLSYRNSEKKVSELFAREAKLALDRMNSEIKSSKSPIIKALPAPSPRDVSDQEIMGRYVVLEDFRYPTNAFVSYGREYVFVGSRSAGFYYVDIGGRSWLGPYEALKRYRRLINSDVPEGGPWTLIGRVTGSQLAVPQAEKEKTVPAAWGWVVEPLALYVSDKTFAQFKPELESGGSFAGEEQMEKTKGQFYTAREIPADVTPERLVEIYATAIKEKNYPLFLECIDPERKDTNTELSRIRYFWDLHQERFARFYVHVTVEKAIIDVIKGFDAGSSLDSFYLDEAQRNKVKAISGQMVEEASLTTKAWDERGRQYGSPKPHFLKRVDKKRWYITNYAQQF